MTDENETDTDEERGIAIVPVEQRLVTFYEDELLVVIVTEDGQQQAYIPVINIVNSLGLNLAGQRQRIQRDPVLAKMARIINIPRGNEPGNPATLCLPLDFLNGFLFGINASRVKPELRERLIRYQEECYRVLAAAFVPHEPQSRPTSETAALMQIEQMGLAMVQMAREQLEIIRGQQSIQSRLDRAALVVGEHGRRIAVLEQQLSPRQAITEEQAADIAEKVKALALALTNQDSSKNHFQAVFAELYRRFRVSSYKTIRQAQYHLVVDFLDEWSQAIHSS